MSVHIGDSRRTSRALTVWRRGIVGIVFMLATASGVRAQATPIPAAETPPDSTALAHKGVQDGTRAADRVATRGTFVGGLASGLLGPLWGLLVVVPIANRAVPLGPAQRAAMTDTSLIYSRTFQQAFARRVQAKRRGAAIKGNLILGIPLLLLAAQGF